MKKYSEHEVYGKHVVIIFDECHRSQFGDMHTAIIKNFKNYHLFWFYRDTNIRSQLWCIQEPGVLYNGTDLW
ncbi:MAG: DEAD/DEAH box helicase family protein [Megasphaera cerevisiae]|nr:DEAD/DEAH box helicase family protein [Megasphaera cerevisiae]